MGKKSKVGKQRKDKFYQLAKETGYRSRAAFKLIQLNRKFEFLQKSRVLIDLCAAPGGWMQVAKQNMPVSSIVIGVDMYPFKPLPGCITLLEDITTDKCRVALQKELKTWKADVVLHDGAPNVGKNWLHDAYTQSCLTLSALKLATAFLREGGWFITKVFRSKDYNSLLWVFKQLFKKVHATKPQASRNESAEIFVVCDHYLGSKKLDPKYLNPDYVFKEIEAAPEVTLRLGKTRKVKALGYPDDTSILHTKLFASTFMQSDNPAIALQNAYEIIIDDEKILNHPTTTEEIKKCCEDIKVLGRKELRELVSWWKVFQQKKPSEEETKLAEEAENKDKDDSCSEEEKELDEIGKQIQQLEDEQRRAEKRKKKKTCKERAKVVQKMQLNMVHKDDPGPVEEAEHDLFRLSNISTKKILKKVTEQKPDTIIDSDEESKAVKFPKRIKYDPEKSHLDSSGNFYTNDESEEEDDDDDDDDSDDISNDKESLGLSDDDDEQIETDDDEQKRVKKKVRFADSVIDNEPVEESHPLITDLDYRDVRDKRLSKAQLWFDKDVFKDIEREEDEDYELDKMTSLIKNMGGKVIEKKSDTNNKVKTSDGDFYNAGNLSESDDDDSDSSSDEEEDESNNSNNNTADVKNKSNSVNSNNNLVEPINEWDVGQSNTEADKKQRKKERKTLDDVGLALGSMMVESTKLKRDIIDAAWNRYAFNDENLPDWFVQDEEKFMKKEAPVPKELVDEYKKKREEINVRPIKRIAEAKARKKKRAARKLEKAKKKLEVVMENPDVTDNEKAKQIRQIYRRVKQQKPNVKYLVAKKHTAAKRAKRPRGLKGPYKVVDPRMKKDLRAKISSMTKSKSKTAAKKIKKTFKPNRRK